MTSTAPHTDTHADLADELPEHIQHYVRSIRPHLMGDQRTVEFARPLLAIDERDIITLAAVLTEHPARRVTRTGHCFTCGSRDCEPGGCPGPSPDDDLMLATDAERNSGAVR